MPRKPNSTLNAGVVVARFAWLSAFVVPLLLSGLLLAASRAPAAPGGPAVVPLAFDEEFEAEEEGAFESDECDDAEEELEEGELGELEVEQLCDEEGSDSDKADGSTAPEECLLRSAHARAVADSGSNKLKLTVGYTTWEPVAATVEVNAGSDRLVASHRRLGRSGVLRLVETLGQGPAPHRVAIRFRIPNSPPSCAKFQTQKVPVGEAGGDSAARRGRDSKLR